MSKGRFIVFEGIDGCGKTTQFMKFINYLYNKDKHNHILMTREPWKERKIREILREDDDAFSQAEKLANMFVKDRREHVSKLIIPNLNTGINVISDRYLFSTICYQTAQGLSMQRLIEMHRGLIVPDLIFILDLSLKEAGKRMKKEIRNEQKFEKNKEFLEKVRKNYLKMPEVFKKHNNIEIINSNQTIRKVHDDVVSAFESRIK